MNDKTEWVMVPREPTPEMVRAAGHVNSEWLNDMAPRGESMYAQPIPLAWKAMLSAAPTPPVQDAQPMAWLKRGGKIFVDAVYMHEENARASADRDKGAEVVPLYATPPDAAKRMAELEVELSELKKDAERYRWLRSAKTGKPVNCMTGGAWGAWINGPELDASIDASIQKGTP